MSDDFNIEFFGHNLHVTDEKRAFAETKLRKVMRFLDSPVEVKFTLGHEKHRQIVELHVTHRHGTLQAREEHEQMLEAMALAIEKVEKQARRSKQKSVDTRRRANRSVQEELHWPVNVIERGSFGDGAAPRIIKQSHFPIKPMTIEEAALALQTSKNDFVVFRESASSRINVLYRRKDQNFGLITPEI